MYSWDVFPIYKKNKFLEKAHVLHTDSTKS